MSTTAITPITEIDEIVTYIYQGSLEPRPWMSFLRCLRARLHCDSAMLWLRPSISEVAPLIIWDRAAFPHTEQDSREQPIPFAQLSYLDPFNNATWQPGDIRTLDEITPAAEQKCSDYYIKLMKPYQHEYEMRIYLNPIPGWTCQIAALNGPEKGNFSAPARQFFSAFRPHMERALKLFALLKLNELEKDLYGQALDQLTIGVIILDRHGFAIESNRLAKHILQSTDSLSLVHNRLVFSSPADNRTFYRTIDAAVTHRERCSADPFVDAFRVEGPGDTSLGLLIRTAPSPEWYQTNNSPSVIVYIENLNQPKSATEPFVARLFGLSKSEAHLATLMVNGNTLAQAAVEMGLSEDTVRKYSKTIYQKTGVSGQTGLIRLIVQSVAMLGSSNKYCDGKSIKMKTSSKP